MSEFVKLGNIRVLEHQRSYLEFIRKNSGTSFAESVRQMIQKNIDEGQNVPSCVLDHYGIEGGEK